jgi:hypothetical protein
MGYTKIAHFEVRDLCFVPKTGIRGTSKRIDRRGCAVCYSEGRSALLENIKVGATSPLNQLSKFTHEKIEPVVRRAVRCANWLGYNSVLFWDFIPRKCNERSQCFSQLLTMPINH